MILRDLLEDQRSIGSRGQLVLMPMGVGRRFFIFPGLSLADHEQKALRVALQTKAGRSVILTPSKRGADALVEELEAVNGLSIFTAQDIETSKIDFIDSDNATAILANRFDGVDFPGDECRLLCLDGLPNAGNLQEKFLMLRMGARALFNERIRTGYFKLPVAVQGHYKIDQRFMLLGTN